MRGSIAANIDWSPDVLPFAPRPINGELLSSWARRLAGANGITLPELSACLGDRLGSRAQAAVFDYAAPKWWRLTLATMARIPERWVWALDLQQHFPAIGREWFLHDPLRLEGIVSAFCPECFHEQTATGRTGHLKAEWALAFVTRCFEHQLPLYRYCPWCGQDQPVHFPSHFPSHAAVECMYCQHPLTERRWTRRPPSPEPGIAAWERAVVEMLAGAVPDPTWTGASTTRSCRALLTDLVWVLTTDELIDPSQGYALVDRIVADRFLPRHPYGEDFETPFYARPWTEREAVVSAILQILLGPEADRHVGRRTCWRKGTRQFQPFVEILRSIRRNPDRLWVRLRAWPVAMQDRAQAALAFLEAERSTFGRKPRHPPTAL